MRWLRRGRGAETVTGDADWTARELKRSSESLEATTEEVIIPLRKIRDKNNVSALVRLLLEKRQGEAAR